MDEAKVKVVEPGGEGGGEIGVGGLGGGAKGGGGIGGEGSVGGGEGGMSVQLTSTWPNAARSHHAPPCTASKRNDPPPHARWPAAMMSHF